MRAWLALAQPYALFWDLTVREVIQIIDGLSEAEDRQIEQRRALNHELAGLLSYSYHDPKQMPKYEPMKKGGGRQAEIDDINVRAALKAMAGQRAQNCAGRGLEGDLV